MEEDMYTDSIDDIISCLNTRKQANLNEKYSIQHLLDQAVKNDILEINTLLKTTTTEKKPPLVKPKQTQEKTIEILSNKIVNMYLNPPIKTDKEPQKRKQSASSERSAISNADSYKHIVSFKSKMEERNLTLHDKVSNSTINTIRYLKFIPLTRDIKEKPPTPSDNGYYFKMNSNIALIKNLLLENGFLETNDFYEFTILWYVGPIKNEIYQCLTYYQKVNHFPKSYEITRKDSMHRNISRMQAQYGLKNFNFIPKSFIFPGEVSLVVQDWEKNKGQWYIVKPQASSQGRGIFITDQIDEILAKQNAQVVVSHYISDPYLINGLKFDLRVYVALTSIHPLRIYIYEEGLVRFATDPYTLDPNSQSNRFAHLTNYSINKFNENFVQNEDDGDEESCSKWSFTAFRAYLDSIKVDHRTIFAKIEDLAIKTILSMEGTVFSATTNQVSFRNNCFELFGFDVLLDSKLKPWLLEVNLSPSLGCEATLDLKIKGELISDLFTMSGVVPLDQRMYSENQNIQKNSNYYNHNLNVPNYDKKSFNLTEVKPVTELTKEEKMIVKETNEEFERRGKFKRIYPSATVNDYAKFFENDRPYNKILRNIINDNMRKIHTKRSDSMNKPIENLKPSLPSLHAGTMKSGALNSRNAYY